MNGQLICSALNCTINATCWLKLNTAMLKRHTGRKNLAKNENTTMYMIQRNVLTWLENHC